MLYNVSSKYYNIKSYTSLSYIVCIRILAFTVLWAVRVSDRCQLTYKIL